MLNVRMPKIACFPALVFMGLAMLLTTGSAGISFAEKTAQALMVAAANGNTPERSSAFLGKALM
jgi:hypothetical protein